MLYVVFVVVVIFVCYDVDGNPDKATRKNFVYDSNVFSQSVQCSTCRPYEYIVLDSVSLLLGGEAAYFTI